MIRGDPCPNGMSCEKLVLKCGLSPGDIVMLTAAVRDLHKTYPGRFLTAVETSMPEIWEHNPYVAQFDPSDPTARSIECHYPLIDRCNLTPYHCLHGFIEFLNDQLGLQIRPTEFRGDLHLSQQEKSWASQVHELSGEATPFWIVSAGGKYDVTIKWWQTSRYQKVIDHFRDRILFVQVGSQGHEHPPLDGVVDLRGETNFRELIRLVYHAQGVLCPVTCLMHLAAAVESPQEGLRPAVVVAGGREPAHWEQYPGHRFLDMVGRLPCCHQAGCWKDRVTPLGDGDPRDQGEHLCLDVRNGLPHCMDLISAEEVIEAIESYHRGGRRAYLTARQVPGARRAIERTRDNAFEDLSLTRANARLACERFVRQIPAAPRTFAGRGIVICAGGVRYFTCAWVCIHMLRRLGCQLPIEVWYLGRRELSPAMENLLTPLGVECIDGEAHARTWPCRRLGGWELKAYALVHSRFAEVLFLDADNVAVRDPGYLFETAAFRETGAIFWPDYGHFENTKQAWSLLGMKQPQHPEFESGQMLIDKHRAWPALRLALWLNEQSDFFYRMIHGDKETFHLAWRKLDQPFHFIRTPIATIAWTMCQHDPAGERLFQHRNTDKWSLHGTNARVEGFLFESECLELLAKLRTHWDGNASTVARKRLMRPGAPPRLWVGMASSSDRLVAREATLREWARSDAGHLEVQVISRPTHGGLPASEDDSVEAARQVLVEFQRSRADYLLLLADDLHINQHLWHNLNTWTPWIHREIEVASLYHPGSTEVVCDVQDRIDWVDPRRLFAAQALIVSRERVSSTLMAWDGQPGGLCARLRRREASELFPYHSPSLVQAAWRCVPNKRGHEARNYDPTWKANSP